MEAPEQNTQEPEQQDPNWRAFREARKKDRAEREAAERRAHEPVPLFPHRLVVH